MNFSAKELYALIHNLKQHLWAIRRVDRSGMGTKQDSPALKFESEVDQNNEKLRTNNEQLNEIKTPKPSLVVLTRLIAISHEIAIMPNPGRSFPHWWAPMCKIIYLEH